MSSQSSSRSRTDTKRRRQKIVDAAMLIIGERGYHGFTVQQLAHRCGLSNAGLLHHFGSKQELLLAAVQELERREAAAMAPLVARVERHQGRTGAGAADVIKVLRTMIARAATRPELGRVYAILQSETLDPAHPAHDLFRTRQLNVLNLLTKLVTPYTEEPHSTGRQLLAIMQGLGLQWLREDQSFDVVAEWLRAIAVVVPRLARAQSNSVTRVAPSRAPAAKRTWRRLVRR